MLLLPVVAPDEDVDVRAGAVHLAMAGSEAALATLRDQLGDLRDQLSRSGLDLGDVTLRQDAADPGRGGAQDRPAPQQQPDAPLAGSGQPSDGRSGAGSRREGAPAGPTSGLPDAPQGRSPGARSGTPPTATGRDTTTTSIDVRV